MDERVSIRDSGIPLKKYGSINRKSNLLPNTCYVKHVVTQTDTIQGLALKYGCTTEKIRKANRLFANDSLFLREHLYVPTGNVVVNAGNGNDRENIKSPPSDENNYYCREDCNNFLNKIDSKIASARAQVIDSQKRSSYYPQEQQVLFTWHRRIPSPESDSDDNIPYPIIVTQNKKMSGSRLRLKQNQEELFPL
ncbi:lysM and putative peptidoglycan-binding domain-containing protein 1-like [Adelges cooleyi]|uniref:lysM and putative peptidoglycan-binding domain-containing protein 1-like n=1 Tax=Adelges cooleyi TaxID=133065 RepID=UPI00217F5945|nr:lysM and putative peptidoglycan-binding domain-containing protein 1-like [Adelges cooleyi]XP_050433571.1 lysM and putative peptidoglycan-binding domain-containing protein 1-like [Adelges cooleyi]